MSMAFAVRMQDLEDQVKVLKEICEQLQERMNCAAVEKDSTNTLSLPQKNTLSLPQKK